MLNTLEQLQTEVSQDNCEVISLFIQHFLGELPLSTSLKVDSLINSCKECQSLYEEICFFFDEKENFIYEIMNPDKIQRSIEQLYQLTLLYSDTSLQDEEEPYYYDELDDCFCCGS